jgi:hypothetical protein
VEVDKKGTNKVEVAERVTYDDVNESLCMPSVVHKVRVRRFAHGSWVLAGAVVVCERWALSGGPAA